VDGGDNSNRDIGSNHTADNFETCFQSHLQPALGRSGCGPDSARMGQQCRGKDYESWVEAIIAFYGDVKPSMLQDFERGG
jgi:hypothetical protein